MSEHVRDLLSSYVDGALPAADRARVDKHLHGCKQCSEELEGLKKVSKMVSSLPRKELPPGFMDRLKAKMKAEEKKPAASTGFSLPFSLPKLSVPMRVAAFAATGVLVCLITFREIKFRMAPSILPDSMDLAAPMTAGAADTEVDRYMASQSAAGARERGMWSGLEQSAENAGASVKEDLNSLRRKLETRGVLDLKFAKKSLRRIGAPVAAEAARGSADMTSSNEDLQGFLQNERRRMGIQEIIPPSAAPDPKEVSPGLAMPPGPQGNAWEGVPDRPMSREEAMAGVRQMASNLSRMNENYRWQKNPTVPMDTGFSSKPKILASKSKSQPLGAKEGAPAKTADHLTSPLAEAKGGGAAVASGDSFAFVKKETLVRRPLYWTRTWSNRQGGMGTAGGAVIRRPDHFEDLWSRVKFEPALPPVDFNKNMVVAVFAEHSETESRSVEIVSLIEEDGRIFIRFRVKTDESAGAVKPTDPYHVVIVPASDLPYTFTQVD
ncbi:MAG: zf-HC2 domain-containing protein [Elusimicrobiota bacterium]